MDSEADIEGLKLKALCVACVGEAYLRNEMKTEGRIRRCAYCGGRRRSYAIGDMAERIEAVFAEHYQRTSDQPDTWERMAAADKESDYDWERHGEPVVWAIANAAEIPEAAASDIRTILGDAHADFDLAMSGDETEFHRDSHYEDKPTSDHGWQEEWEGFEHALRSQARFFSRPLSDHLASVFQDVDKLSASKGRALVIDIGPGTAIDTFYRARAFQSDAPLVEALARPDRHLGPPPAPLAAAGRMNAQGIAVFYGATDAGVAIAEVRPPVGAQVAVARFQLLRRLRVLDLTALSEVSEIGSLFDVGLSERLARAKFLRSLSGRMTRSVMPNEEALDYLPTQAIADFLAWENVPRLDGILFPSVQAGAADASNAVLFHMAARVEDLELPKGAEIEARTGEMYEEGWVQEYSVVEKVRPADAELKASREPVDWSRVPENLGGSMRSDPREPTLRVDAQATVVHHVTAARFDTVAFDVRRWRWEMTAFEDDLVNGEGTLPPF